MAYSEEKIVNGLLKNNVKVFNYLYERYLSEIVKHTVFNSGSEEDGEDLCQFTMMALTESVLSGKFVSIKIEGYIRTIYKRKWFKILRDRERKQKRKEKYTDDTIALTYSISDPELQGLQGKRVMHHLKRLGKECQDIINLKIWGQKTHAEIAELLTIKGTSSRVKYSRCMTKLKKFCFDDPDFPTE